MPEMFTVSLEGLAESLEGLDTLPTRLRTALTGATLALSQRLQNRAQQKHLSGPTGEHSLSVRTGNLRASVHVLPVVQTATGVSGGVGYGATVAYAAIHEFGGVINVPEIFPRNAKALHFFSGGKEIFAAYTRAHTVVMPKRAPLSTALEEMEQEITDVYNQAAREAMKAP